LKVYAERDAPLLPTDIGHRQCVAMMGTHVPKAGHGGTLQVDGPGLISQLVPVNLGAMAGSFDFRPSLFVLHICDEL
jgi:hypothetical protein